MLPINRSAYEPYKNPNSENASDPSSAYNVSEMTDAAVHDAYLKAIQTAQELEQEAKRRGLLVVTVPSPVLKAHD